MMLWLVLLSAVCSLALGADNNTSGTLPKLPQLDSRIVGGENADISQYPHQLSLQYYNTHICGACIISPLYAVTAAHCTDKTNARALSVRAGSSRRGSGGQVVSVKRIFQNPRFDVASVDYDISVLGLSEPLRFGRNVKSIRLPAPQQVIRAGTEVEVSGWGTLSEGGSAPTQLQSVVLEIVPKQECLNTYGPSQITDRMFCAGSRYRDKDTCQGDSGGPLIDPIRNELIGIVSWGYGCARPKYPGVYASVPKLRRFITETSRL